MEIARLKEYILENDKVYSILEELGCHHIKNKNIYISCGNPDGDNPNAIVVYLNDYLITEDFTRNISNKKNNDIFDLVCYFKKCNFFEALNMVCSWIGLDYYYDFNEDLPESIRITKLIMGMESDSYDEEDKPLKPINEKILSYYLNTVNDLFKNDGISYSTQREFEIGYDTYTNRITIPIRDELGNLVGVKGRLFSNEISEDELKYLYIEPCQRSQVLYGLYKTYDYIKKENVCYVGEAEKSVMQLWNAGYKNCVATSGKKVSKSQIEKLTRLCVDIVFVFDKDVTEDELEELANRFVDGVSVSAIIDRNGILSDKESPTDNIEKFKELCSKSIVKLK